MIACAVVAIACAVIAYVVLAGCAPGLAADIGWGYALVIVGGWGVLARRLG